MMSNLEIWNAVEKTDPEHTKRVTQRGGFTAIDAHYQFFMATEQFGPIGIGWGFIADAPIFEAGAVIVPVTIWHGARENTFGPFYGCADFSSKRLDTDAPKKATTDGITKALSMLGFNADVFMGKFDDNKYVETRRQEERMKDAPVVPSKVLEVIKGAANMQSLQTVWTANKDWQAHPDFLAAKDKRKSELTQNKDE